MTNEESIRLLWKLILRNRHRAKEIYYLVLGFLGE